MEVAGLAKLIDDNIDKILDKQTIKKLLSMQNNLFRFDSLNRIFIYLQNEDAYDIRHINEWEIEGRTIHKHSNPIYTLIPSYGYKYITRDEEGNKEADISDLNPIEKVKALELGIINRVESVDNISIIPMYDIRQTKSLENKEFRVPKPKLSSTSLLKLFTSITESLIEECDEFYYSVSDNILYIPKVEYMQLVKYIVQAFCKYYINKKGIEQDKVESYIAYSITSLFRGNTSNISIKEPVDLNEYIQITSYIDEIIEELTSKIEFTGNTNTKGGAERNIVILKKAEIILDAMDANSINKKLTDI